MVNDRNTIDLCPKDPGFPVDLYVTTDIRTKTAQLPRASTAIPERGDNALGQNLATAVPA